MMRLGLIGMVSAAVLAAHAARAQTRPVLEPQRDAALTYHVESTARDAPSEARVIVKAGGKRLRIEPNNQPGFILVDRNRNDAVMVMAGLHMAVHVGLGDAIDRTLFDPRNRFRRLGEDRVAGLTCTVWELRSPNAEGEGCVTADGLVLRAAGHAAKGGQGKIVATAVDLSPQPDSAFVPPADYPRLDMSNLSRAR